MLAGDRQEKSRRAARKARVSRGRRKKGEKEHEPSSTTPILRIFDEAKAREFYVAFLELSVDWEHRFGDNFPLYMQVSKDTCIIHLSEHYGDCSPGSAVESKPMTLAL